MRVAICGASRRLRVYDETTEERAIRIAVLLGKGLTIEDVKRLKPCLDQHDRSACDDPNLALRTYHTRLAVMDNRLAALHGRRDQLAQNVQPG